MTEIIASRTPHNASNSQFLLSVWINVAPPRSRCSLPLSVEGSPFIIAPRQVTGNAGGDDINESAKSRYTVGIFDGWKALRQFSIGTKPTSATSLVMPFRLKKPSSAIGMIRSSLKNNSSVTKRIRPLRTVKTKAKRRTASVSPKAKYRSSPSTYPMTSHQQEIYDEG